MCVMAGNFQLHTAALHLLESSPGIRLGILVTCTLEDMLDFCNSYYRCNAHEDEVEGEEDTQRTNIYPNLYDRRHIETPA